MSRGRDALRGLAAWIVLLAVTIGVPVLLVRGVGWPLWESVPDLGAAPDLLRDGLPERAFLRAVAVVCWVVWAQFVTSLLLEVIATVRGRAARDVPLVAGEMQSGVARLVASALLLFSALAGHPSGSDAPPLPPVVADAGATLVDAGEPTTPVLAEQSAPAERNEWVVQRRDSLWGIAEATLGDGSRFGEILELNRGRAQPGGGALRDASEKLVEGWRLVLPADAVVPGTAGLRADGTYVVQPGDSLSRLSLRFLGDLHRWTEIFDLNRERPQPDGQSLTDPDLIRPGWVLQLPAVDLPDTVTVSRGDTLSGLAEAHLGDAERWPELYEANVGKVQPDGRALQDPDQIDVGWELDLPEPAIVPASTPAPPAPAPLPEPADGPPLEPAVPDATAEVSLDPDRVPEGLLWNPGGADHTELAGADDRDDGDGAPHVVGLGGGRPPDQDGDGGDHGGGGGDRSSIPAGPVGVVALGVAGLVAALDAARRVHQHGRAAHERPVVPDGHAGALERRLRTAARADVPRAVDLALRALAAGHPTTPDDSRIRRVVVDDRDITVFVDGMDAPPGFRSVPGGVALGRDTPLDVLEALAGTTPPPAPALVPIGEDEHGGVVLLDLEALDQPVTVAGDATVARWIAQAALTMPWSAHAARTVVGDAGPAHLPGVRAVASMAEALAGHDPGRRGAALAAAGGATPFAARLRAPAPDLAPALVVLDGAPGQPVPDGVVVVAPAPDGAPATLVVEPGGTVRLPDGGVLRAPEVDPADVAVLDDLFRTAGRSVRAVPSEASAATGPVRVDVLGPVRVTVDGAPAALTHPRTAEALAWLAVQPAGAGRDALVAALWPDGVEPDEETSLVGELRSLLGDGDGAVLAPDSDVAELRRRVADAGRGHGLARLRAVAAAAELVRGRPFGAHGGAWAWSPPEIGVLEAEISDVLADAVDAALAAGDVHAAVAFAWRAVDLAPHDGQAHRALVGAVAVEGGRAAVDRALTELARRTGADVDPRVRAFADGILGDAAATA